MSDRMTSWQAWEVQVLVLPGLGEAKEGDPVVGHVCPRCKEPIEVGDVYACLNEILPPWQHHKCQRRTV